MRRHLVIKWTDGSVNQFQQAFGWFRKSIHTEETAGDFRRRFITINMLNREIDLNVIIMQALNKI